MESPLMDSETLVPLDLVNNPYVPPTSTCPINQLPNELLSHIFITGTLYDSDDDYDEELELDESDFAVQPRGDEDDVFAGKIWKDYPGRDARRKKRSNDRSSSSSASTDSDSDYGPILPFQVLVSHVCTHWRSVALATPSLWSSIFVLDDQPPFERVQTWLERSQNLPLKIEIDSPLDPKDLESDEIMKHGDEDEEVMTVEDFTSLIKILYPAIHRWATFEITASSYSHLYSLLEIISAPSTQCANQLTTLQLQHWQEQDDFDFFNPRALNTSFTIFPGGAPKLKDLSLWGVHVKWDDPLLGLWRGGGLVALELAYHAADVRPSWATFVAMLKGSPNLETLTLSQSGPAGAPADWHSERAGDGLSDILELPIKNLVLSWLKPEYVGPLMRRIALPQLTSLTLEFDDADYTEFVRQLAGPATGVSNQNVLGNQAPVQSLLMRLEDLKIASLPCDLQCIDLIYSQLVDLKHLSLACNFVDELFFKKLIIPISGVPNAPVAITPDLTSSLPAVATESLFYLPQLISLRTSGISGPTMRDAVLARQAAGIPLRAVYMDEEDEVTDTQAQWFRRNLETFERFEASDEEDDDDIFDEDSDDGMQEDDADASMVQCRYRIYLMLQLTDGSLY